MRIVENKHQKKDIVKELVNSDQANKLHECIKEIVSEQGYDEDELTRYLRSKLITLKMNPDTVDVLIKNKVVGTVSVTKISTSTHHIYTCSITK